MSLEKIARHSLPPRAVEDAWVQMAKDWAGQQDPADVLRALTLHVIGC